MKFVVPFVVVLFICVSAFATPLEVKKLSRAILFLAKTHKDSSSRKMTQKRADKLANWFWIYGKKWNVDPWMAISIVCQESGFKDRPRRVYVTRCRKRVKNGVKVEVCRKVWPGERGMFQSVPWWSKESFRACVGRMYKSYDEFERSETSICVGIHALTLRKKIIDKIIAKGRYFKARGSRYRWVRRFAPCGWRQILFCKKNAKLCKEWWWIASWNWSPYKVFCNRSSKTFDFAAYPIHVLRRYRDIVKRFK